MSTAAANAAQTRLARSLAPAVVYHPRERYFLTSVDDYFKRTRPFTDKRGVLGRAGLARAGASAPAGGPTDLVGTPLAAYAYPSYAPGAPCYYAVVPAGDREHYYILYYLFWALNGPKRVAGLVPVGTHTADIETVAVKVREADHAPVEFNLSQHGSFVRYRLDNRAGHNAHVPAALVGPRGAPVVRVQQGGGRGRPVIYAALNAHALYNEPGSFLRLGGFGNDVTKNGPVTRLAPTELPADNAVRAWKGRLGDDGVDSFHTRFAPHMEPYVPRPPRVAGGLASAAFLVYLLTPALVLWQLRRHTRASARLAAGLALAAFVAQFYALKVLLTGLLMLLDLDERARPNPDTRDRWLLPLRLD